MGIICKQCGYENPDGSEICEICAESLQEEEKPVNQMTAAATLSHQTQTQATASTGSAQATVKQSENPVQKTADDGFEYFVFCNESSTRTIIPNGHVTSFYCEGCKKTHEIDGAWWQIERKEKPTENVISDDTQASKTTENDNLWLEEINSHVRIDIDKSGGTLGRYGKYGADFFQSRDLRQVSGEHCLISYEFGNWVIRHISRTNQTMYNNMILGSNEPNLLEDGKILTLANAVSFIVRIG